MRVITGLSRIINNACHMHHLHVSPMGALDTYQMELLKGSFQKWVAESRDARVLRSRERVFIIFLMLRYTGAKLGEVLSLNEHEHIDFSKNMVVIPHGLHPKNGRWIPLPPALVQRIKEFGRKPDSGTGRRESLFTLDQGFVRRKFYEQEKRSGLPLKLLKPSVLRVSRAMELLDSGMPERAVQAFLGNITPDMTASCLHLSHEDIQQIILQHCQREYGMETSARNTFYGRISSVSSSLVMSEVVVTTSSGNLIAAVITNQSMDRLNLALGKMATARIKATLVNVEKEGLSDSWCSANAFPGTISRIVSDNVIAEVNGILRDGTPVCALISTQSLQQMGIGERDSCVFRFQAMSVILS